MFFCVVFTVVPYKEKPCYNSRRRTAAPRVFSLKASLSQPGNNILSMQQMSGSTPQLKSRDPDSSSIASSHSGYDQFKNQRPAYDSDSPYVDSASCGNLTLQLINY